MQLSSEKITPAKIANLFIGTVEIGLGCMGLIAFGGATVVIIQDGSSFIAFMISAVATCGFFIMFWAGLRRRRTHRLFLDYAMRLSADPEHSIALLASSIGKPEKKVARDLNLMIKYRYFPNAYIDTAQNRLVLKGDAARRQEDTALFPAQRPTRIVVTCPGCGAANLLEPGKICECEYCGSLIGGESQYPH